MAFLVSFKYKLLVSVVVAIVSALYQLESPSELHVAEKQVMLSKGRLEAYEHISNLEEFTQWFPNVLAVESIDKNKHLGIGKRYAMLSTYLFGIGESTSELTIIGYQKPVLLEFVCDNTLLERNRLSFKSADGNRTVLTWNIYSRRKSLLFRYTTGPLYQFYYNQILREALFSLQFLLKK